MYDIIVLGAGPAGLAIASELSKKHTVLIIEKGKIGETTKAWTTDEKIIRKAGLGKFVTGRFEKCYLQSTQKNKFYIKNKTVTVDEHAVLKYWAKKTAAQSAVFKENTKFLGLAQRKDCAQVKTTKGIFTAKIVIDAMGIESPIAKKYKIYQKLFYWPIYGEEITTPHLTKEDYILGLVMAREKPITWAEVFAAKPGTSVVYVFKYLAEKTDPLKLEKEQREFLDHSEFKNKFRGYKIIRRVHGVIPMGLSRTHIAGRVFFFGDTGLLAPSALGSGFTNIIQHHKRFAHHISNCIRKNKFDEKSLDYPYTENEVLNREVQLLIGLIFLHATAEDMDAFLNGMGKMSNKLLLDMLFMRLTPAHILLFIKMLVRDVGLGRLEKIIPKKEYGFVLKTIEKILGEELIIEEKKL
jgi:flavin-dependent dehydrogenase